MRRADAVNFVSQSLLRCTAFRGAVTVLLLHRANRHLQTTGANWDRSLLSKLLQPSMIFIEHFVMLSVGGSIGHEGSGP